MADSDEKNKKGRTAIENIYKNILGDRITYNEPKYFFSTLKRFHSRMLLVTAAEANLIKYSSV